MNLMVLTCAVFPSEEAARKRLWIFLRSCEKFGIHPHMYGLGHPGFPGYIHMKLDMQLAYLRANRHNYTHVLYTDGWDAFFVAPLEEIQRKYDGFGRPPILGAAFDHLSNSENSTEYDGCFDPDVVYRYPHVGGYIAEIPAMIEAFSHMNHRTGDDCFSWYDAWKEGVFRPQLDSGTDIFQVTGDNCEIRDGRVYNIVTGGSPCILHLSGGYTDPETGKDDRMIPWAKALGVIE